MNDPNAIRKTSTNGHENHILFLIIMLSLIFAAFIRDRDRDRNRERERERDRERDRDRQRETETDGKLRKTSRSLCTNVWWAAPTKSHLRVSWPSP